ncbi:MAG: transposase [Candidatus Binatia bacterium]
MFEAALPSSLQALLVAFAPCFTRPGGDNFATLVSGWILCPARHSISRVIQAASGDFVPEKHHASFYRFLSHGSWVIDALGEVLFDLLLPWLPPRITLILDDTLCHKSGPHLFGAAMHYDAHASTYGRGTSQGRKGFFAFGHNWVVAAVWLPLPWNPARGLALPLLIRLYRSKKRCPAAQYRKRTAMAAELVELLAGWLPADRSLHVVADAEYACKTVVRKLPDKVSFTGPMSMDAALYDQPGPYRGRGRRRLKGQRLPSPKQLAARTSTPWRKRTLTIYGRQVTLLVKTQLALWYTVAGTQRLSVVVTRDAAGRLRDGAFFSTDDKSSASDILIQFARRWEIEVAFRNTKQAMGLEDPQNGWWRRKAGTPRPKKRPGPNPRGEKGATAVNHTLILGFTAYALVVLWYLKHGHRDDDVARVRSEAPWYRHKHTPSFTDMLAALRRQIWIARLSQHPVLKPLCEKIDALLPHWLLAA